MNSVTALYYPFHPKEEVWLKHTLLYYDFIGSTVPESFEQNPDSKYIKEWKLPEHLEILRERGIYKSLTDSIGIKELTDYLKNVNAFASSDIEDLEGFGLKWMVDPRFETIDTSTGRFVKFNNILAEGIVALNKDLIVPATDIESSFEHLYGNQPREPKENHMKALTLTYNELLPSPTNDVPLSKILKFKEKRKDELLRFRTSLGKVRERIGKSESVEELKYLLFEINQEMKVSISDLRRALGSDSISTISSAIKELSKVKPNLITSIGSALVGGTYLTSSAKDLSNVSLQNVVSGLAISSMVLISSALVAHIDKRKKIVAENPYAYLYLAQKAKITNRT